jgi:hypothetical protein
MDVKSASVAEKRRDNLAKAREAKARAKKEKEEQPLEKVSQPPIQQPSFEERTPPPPTPRPQQEEKKVTFKEPVEEPMTIEEDSFGDFDDSFDEEEFIEMIEPKKKKTKGKLLKTVEVEEPPKKQKKKVVEPPLKKRKVNEQTSIVTKKDDPKPLIANFIDNMGFRSDMEVNEMAFKVGSTVVAGLLAYIMFRFKTPGNHNLPQVCFSFFKINNI